MARDETFNIFVFITLFLDIEISLQLSRDNLAAGLYLSREAATVLPGKNFAVSCRDKTGQAVTWRGPRGPLGPFTRPKVQDTSIGKLLIFDDTKIEDSGNYSCSLSMHPEARKFLSLRVEDTYPHYRYTTTTDPLESSIYHRPQHSGNKNNNFPPNKHNKHFANRPIYTEKDLEEYPRRPQSPWYSYTSTEDYDTTPSTTESNLECNIIVEYEDMEEPIEFMDTKEVQRGKEGETIILRCEVNGANNLNWLIENSTISKPKYEVIEDGLVINNLTREDATKVYVCQAVQSETGEMKSCKIRVKVEHKPYPVYEEDNEVYAVLGARVNLTCEVEADPPPRFDWYHYDNNNVKKRIKDYSQTSSHVSYVELIMSERSPERFKCTAINTHGAMDKFFNLHLGTPPEPPLGIDLLKATSNSLELKLELPEVSPEDLERGMQPNFVYIQYKTTDSEDWDIQEFNITEETFALTDLEQKTKYELQAATRNVAAISEYTNTTIFETSMATCRQIGFLASVVIWTNVLMQLSTSLNGHA